jgi:hypothetical protein
MPPFIGGGGGTIISFGIFDALIQISYLDGQMPAPRRFPPPWTEYSVRYWFTSPAL